MGGLSKEAVEALAIAFAYSNSTENFVTDEERIEAETFWAKFFIRNAKRMETQLERMGYTITRTEPAPFPESVEKAIDKLYNDALSSQDGYGSTHDDVELIRAHIAALEAKITTLRNAAEIGLTYVLAAQRGLTFTKPRMSSDVEIFNDALKMGGDE